MYYNLYKSTRQCIYEHTANNLRLTVIMQVQILKTKDQLSAYYPMFPLFVNFHMLQLRNSLKVKLLWFN